MNRRLLLYLLIILILAALIWLAPLSGRIFVLLDQPPPTEWPQITINPAAPTPGEQADLVVADTTPWVHVQLQITDEATNTIQRPSLIRAEQTPNSYRWFWRYTVPPSDNYTLTLLHDCDQGCRLWGRKRVNNSANLERHIPERLPTKLCTVFPNPERNWHNRAGWVVEIAYVQQSSAAYWHVDELAARVHTAVQQGHRVLLRIEYDQTQSIPPPNDEAALENYLAFIRRIARDVRFQQVYALTIGSGYNSAEHNQLAPDNPVTPAWMARVVNGYSTPPTALDNVIAIVRSENPALRVLVGPVQPWVIEGNGERPYPTNAPWLNYFHTLVQHLDTAVQDHNNAGIPLSAPDGFAIQAPGNPDSSKIAPADRAQEPQTDLPSTTWEGAQLGFRVYQDWLKIINSTPSSVGKPVYITASNTYGPDHTGPPAENYPPGWLTNATAEINQQPQIQSLCWFVDHFPPTDQWQAFSLTNPQGQMAAAAAEFDALLNE